MARRGRRGRKGRGKGSKAVPIVQIATLLMPSVNSFRSIGLNEAGLIDAIWNTTGVNVRDIKTSDPKKGIYMAIALLLESTIGAKVANRTGANRAVKKLSGGMIKLF